MQVWPHLITHQKGEDLIHFSSTSIMQINDYYTEEARSCSKQHIVDLWETDKPAYGLNGTGPDKYEEELFKVQLLKIAKNHNASTSLFLYYAAHI